MDNEVTSAGNFVFNTRLILDLILPDLSFKEVLSLRSVNRCCAFMASCYLRRHEAILRIKENVEPPQIMDLVSLITHRKNVDNRLGEVPWSELEVNLASFPKELIEIFTTQVASYFPSFRASFGKNCTLLDEVDIKLVLFLSKLTASLESLCLIGHSCGPFNLCIPEHPKEFGNFAVEILKVPFLKLRKFEYLSTPGICKDFNATICKLAPNLMEISIMEDDCDHNMLLLHYVYKHLNEFRSRWTDPDKLVPVVSYLYLALFTSCSLFINLVDIGFPCKKLNLALVFERTTHHSYQLSLETLLRNSANTLTSLELTFSPTEPTINQLKLPNFVNLTSLRIRMTPESVVRNSTPAFQPFKSGQFPILKNLIFYDYGMPLNPIQAPIPSVTHLSLVMTYSNHPEYEEDQYLLIQALPNLKSLFAPNLSLKIRSYVISKLKDVEILDLNDYWFDKGTLRTGTPEELWDLYTGGAPLPHKKKSDDLNNPSTTDQSHEESPSYVNSRQLPSLENLKHLKILRIPVKSELELDAIIFMTKEKKLPQLHELGISLQEDVVNATYIEILSKYHRKVRFIYWKTF